MTKTVTFKGQKHDVRGDEGSHYITVEVDRREYALYLKALTEIGVEWEYDPELPTDGHYIDDDGDIWFFKDGKGKYVEKGAFINRGEIYWNSSLQPGAVTLRPISELPKW